MGVIIKPCNFLSKKLNSIYQKKKKKKTLSLRFQKVKN